MTPRARPPRTGELGQPANLSNLLDLESDNGHYVNLGSLFSSHSIRNPLRLDQLGPTDPMALPSVERQPISTIALFSPEETANGRRNRRRKRRSGRNCPHRIGRPEYNYNLASFRGSKMGWDRLGQAGTGWDRLFSCLAYYSSPLRVP